MAPINIEGKNIPVGIGQLAERTVKKNLQQNTNIRF